MSMTIEEMIKKQQEYFAAGKTCELAQRIQALNRLEQGILNCEQELYAALKKDLGKSRAESYILNTSAKCGLNSSFIGLFRLNQVCDHATDALLLIFPLHDFTDTSTITIISLRKIL